MPYTIPQAVSKTLSDNATGPNLIGGFAGNYIDPVSHTNIVLGGFTGNPNILGQSFVGIGGHPNDVYVPSTANYSAIWGGYDNINNGLASFIVSQHGRIYTAATHGAILGGSFHTIEDGDYGACVGGTLNTISSNGFNNAILGGSNHTISGTAAGAGIVGGSLNQLSSNYSAAIAAYDCTISANSAAAIAAQESTVSAIHATVYGLQNVNYIQGAIVSGCRRHAANGDSQIIDFHESQETLNASNVDLSPYGSANLVSVPQHTTYVGQIYVVARQLVTGARAAWIASVCISKSTGSVVVDAQSWVTLFDSIGLAVPVVNPTGSSVLRVRCSGIPAAGTIYWSAKLSFVSCTGI